MTQRREADTPDSMNPPDPRPAPVSGPLERYLGWAALAGLLLACVPVLLPFLMALLWGLILCSTTWPLYLHLLARLGGRRTLAASLMSIGLAGVVLVPLAIVGPKLADNVQSLRTTVQRWTKEGLPPPPGWLARVPVVGSSATAYWTKIGTRDSTILEDAKQVIEPVTRGVLSAAAALGRGLVHLILSVFMAFFLFRTGATAIEHATDVIGRIGGARAQRLLVVAAETVRGVVYGILGTALIQAILAGIGFLVAGGPGAGLLSLLLFFLAIVPGGPPLILLPAALWLFGQGSNGWGIFMIAWGIMVSSIDNVVKPWLISQGSDMPFLLICLGVLGGALAYGFIGLFLGPTLLAVAFRVVQEWNAGKAAAAIPSR